MTIFEVAGRSLLTSLDVNKVGLSTINQIQDFGKSTRILVTQQGPIGLRKGKMILRWHHLNSDIHDLHFFETLVIRINSRAILIK